MEAVRVVFDLDGTLIDSARDIQATANAVLAEIGEAPLSLEDTRGFVGNGAAVFVEKMRGARGLAEGQQEALLQRFLHHYVSAVGLTEIYAGVPEALQQLRDQGCRIGLCTNKPMAPSKAILAHLGMAAWFDVVLAGDSLAQRKPHPAPLLAAFDALGAGPCVYVGDSDVDAEAAQRAGVPFVFYSEGIGGTGHIPCDARFDDFAALPGLVRRCAR